MIGSDLLRYNKAQKYLVWDVETTSLNLAYALPWQISYAVFTLDKILDIQNKYIFWKDLQVSADAARITRFDRKGYEMQALPPDEVLREFEAHLFSSEIRSIGHNLLGYDSMIHTVWRREIGLQEDYSYLHRVIDTVALAKAYKKGIQPDKTNFLGFQYRVMSIIEKGLKTNLAAMGREFNIKFDQDKLHDASADILLNIEVFKRLLWKVEI